MTTRHDAWTRLSLALGLVALDGCERDPAGDASAGSDYGNSADFSGDAGLDEDTGEGESAAPLDDGTGGESGLEGLASAGDDGATASAAVNLAFGRPATQSATLFDAGAWRAVDGNTDGSFWSGSVTHTDDVASWWQVDLLAVEPIGEIVIHNRADCCAERLHDFAVRVSADGVNWDSFPQPGPAGLRTHVLVDRRARYVRIENPRVMHIAEVEVFRTRNLAYGRPTMQSSTAIYADSSRAVDGNTDGEFAKGSVTHTDVGTEWWQVDLESVQNVGQVVVFNRTDCCASKLHDATVSISTDGSNWEDLSFPGPAGAHLLASFNRPARFVRVQNGSGQPLHLAEVQVFEQPQLPLSGASYGRGVGTVPAYGCAPDEQYDAGLCYDWCAPGFTNVLNLCYQNCAPGYTDMGLYCIDYASAGWPSYGKSIYDRGVGTVPTPTCSAGMQLDAGLCYPSCAPGYVGVGPVCWFDGLGIDDIGVAACELLRVPILSQLAQDSGLALTAGGGAGLAAGLSASAEIGVAYGAAGEFGCYVTGCGGITTNVALSAYGALGAYGQFSDIAGDAIVVSGGLSLGIPSTPISLGGSLGLVTDLQGAPVGSTISAAISVGADAVTPIDLGALTCHTEVLQTQ